MAAAIHRLGIQEGDGIAIAADPYLVSLWARLARVKIVAEIPARAVSRFDLTDSVTRDRIYDVLKQSGARALVVRGLTSLEPREKWYQLPGSKYYVYIL